MPEDSLIERDRHDGDAVACLIAPQVLAAGATNTPTIFMGGRGAPNADRGGGYDRALFCILGGAANDATATLTMLVQQCNTAGGGGPKPLAGLYGTKSIGPVTSGQGYATLNQKWLIEVAAEEMDVDNGFSWLRLVVTVSTADTWLVAVEAQRSGAAYEPVLQTNITGLIGTTA